MGFHAGGWDSPVDRGIHVGNSPGVGSGDQDGVMAWEGGVAGQVGAGAGGVGGVRDTGEVGGVGGQVEELTGQSGVGGTGEGSLFTGVGCSGGSGNNELLVDMALPYRHLWEILDSSV